MIITSKIAGVPKIEAENISTHFTKLEPKNQLKHNIVTMTLRPKFSISTENIANISGHY